MQRVYGPAPRRLAHALFPLELSGMMFVGAVLSSAAASPPVQMAEAPADVWELGKEALGLGETTPEGEESTGIANGVPFVVRFRDTVGSLKAGAPVLVRGMRMGLVREVKVTFDPSINSFVIPVVIELDPTPFLAGENAEHAARRVEAIMGDMVRNGLRAELASGNLLIGALAVALEIEAGAPPAELGQGHAGMAEIPTARSPYRSPTDQLEQVMTRVAALPLEQVVGELNGLIGAARKIVDDPALLQLLRNLATTSEELAVAAQQLEPALEALTSAAEQARASLAEAERLADDSQALPEELHHLLEEGANAARSLRTLMDMLVRQPEALLRGRSG